MITRTEMEEWVAALRSGDYEQGAGYLCTNTSTGARYCCLGVLVEVLHGAGDWKNLPHHPRKALRSRTFGDVANIPAPVLGSLNKDYVTVILANENDRGVPFDEIADWIEQTFDRWKPVAPEPH